MIDFNNTEIAFRIRSKGELIKAKLLFGAVKSPAMVKVLNGITSFALKVGFPVGWLVKPTLYVQFVGGERLSDCDKTAQKLSAYGVSSILDYSVEGKEDNESIEACFEEIKQSVLFGAKRSYVAFAVFKPTGITHAQILEKISSEIQLSEEEQGEYERFVKRVDVLCALAAQVGTPILIDAEDYCYQKAIDEVVEMMMERYNKEKAVVYNTLQMYRTDRLDYLKMLHQKAREVGFKAGVKFVRGAYMEKERLRATERGYPSPINPTKEVTDQMYDDALIYTMQNIDDFAIFVGTHNEDSIKLLVELVYKYAIDVKDSRIWLSQLYGMSDNLSFNLAYEGFNVAKYLPYGPVKEVLPYLTRRATENTAVAGQTSRELNLINQEIERRKAYKEW